MSILPLFPKNAYYYFCSPKISRAMASEDLCRVATNFGLSGKEYSSVSKALSVAKLNSRAKDVVYVGGSTFVVAEII